MKKIFFAASLLSLLLLNCITRANAEDGMTDAKVGPFIITYPSEGWEIQKLPPPPEKGSSVFALGTKGGPKLSVILTDMVQAEDLIVKQRELGAAEMSRAFGLPMALAMAKPDQAKIYYSIGSMELSDSSDLSARFLLVNPTSSKSTTIDAFTYLPESTPGHILLGAIISQGTQNPDDWKSLKTNRIAEAYEIVRSIAVAEQE